MLVFLIVSLGKDFLDPSDDGEINDETVMQVDISENASNEESGNESIYQLYENESGEEGLENESSLLPDERSAGSSTSSRGRMQCMTEKLCAIVDKLKISDRNATHLLVAAAEGFGVDPKNYVLNRTSIRERRIQVRLQRFLHFQEQFEFPETSFLVIHWDGKLLPAVTGNEKVDRLAVLASFDNKEQLLGVPITGGKGEDMANTVHSALVEWGIEEKIVGMCYDTTASNTGPKSGACMYLEALLERKLLNLACRHHMYEIVLRGVFDSLLGPTSGPDTPLFKRFQDSWPKIDKKKMKSGMEESSTKERIEGVRERVLTFVTFTLGKKQFRDDYRELLELVALFLDSDISGNINVQAPGAIHHARWMAKALYSLKIFLFREQFDLTKRELYSLREICIFLVMLYVKVWFEAPNPVEAPYNDFKFLEALVAYKSINKEVSEAAIKKFVGHLWYLSPVMMGFSIFDKNVPLDIKEKMRKSLLALEDDERNNSSNDQSKVQHIEPRFVKLKASEVESFISNQFYSLVSRQTFEFFELLNINYDFLRQEPDLWPQNPTYSASADLLHNIRVVNDVAERGIKLISNYNNALTKNESQTQYLLHVVSEYNKKYPDSRKATLVQ
jgi:hypothetical protein